MTKIASKVARTIAPMIALVLVLAQARLWAATSPNMANPPPPSSTDSTADETDTGWPREITNNEQITIYEPQIEKWQDNRLEERAAVSVLKPASPQPVYGVIWISARTEIDKANHIVTLEDIRFVRASFPSEPGNTSKYLALLRKNSPSLVRKIALDRLQAGIALTRSESKHAPALRNTPPQIIYSDKPAVLVLVDGDPVLRDTGVSGFMRVINTRALLVFDQDHGKYFLYMGDRWMESSQTARLEGPWGPATKSPPALDRIKQAAVQQKLVDLMDEPGSPLMQELGNRVIPHVFVSTGPADLIQTQGTPQLQPIVGTKLLYVSNTEDNLFVDTSDQSYYVLLSGRWYRSRSISGPWLFVSSKKIPADFAKIPDSNRKGGVLASVSGTPQAKEALIANEIPQTATVNRSEASLAVDYDGPARFKAIPGTSLFYAENTRTPVIEFDRHSFYAVQDGIWFTSSSPQGPWVVATEVPPAIYAIPPASPMYYVTYVRIYGFTPEVVYVGYTPGYLGSYDCADNVVVFGTGYWYTPWVGTFWVGPPLTFGFGWYWGVGYGWGLYAGAPLFPWWGPWGRLRPRIGFPGTSVGIARFNANRVNVYRSWNHSVVRNTWDRNAIATRSYTERYGFSSVGRPNDVYAGRNGHVYRYNSGHWEEHAPSGWNQIGPEAAPKAPPSAGGQRAGMQPPPGTEGLRGDLERSRTARQTGENQWNTFRQGGAGFGRGGGRHG